MTKYKKLALSPSGEIVNRSTGRLVRAKGLTVRSNRVYDKNGRLYGYLGKQTKKEREKTEKLDTQRQKKREYTAKKKQSQTIPKPKTTKSKKDVIEPLPTSYTNETVIEENDIELDITEPEPLSEESLLLITDIDRWMKFVESDERVLPNYKRIKQEEANFARSVNGRVDDEKHDLSYEEGEKLKQKWKEATTDEERTEVWNELKKMDPNKGYSYDPEVMTTS